MSLRSTRLAVDIGGTFTDVALESDGVVHTGKVLTIISSPTQAVMQAIEKVLTDAAIDAGDVGVAIHGTTLATNTVIERSGAHTALITTEGFKDSVEMGYEHRFEQYDVFMNKPPPLVPRYLRLPVIERVGAHGEVLLPLDEDSVYALIPWLRQHAIQSVAIGLIHSYVYPRHEQRVAAILREEMPDLWISLSSEVCPEVREYERMSTTCANAYVQPLMAGYLVQLQDALNERGFRCPLYLMMSGGGLTTVDTAVRFPIRLVESGPAGGAILASHIASQCGLDQVLSYDMGGTTAKICLIDNGRAQTSRSFEIDRQYRFIKGSGLPVRIPVIEMIEIGAGGGSIARVDAMKRLQVGPQSAGSDPGPACYGRGGQQPTVTDADVVLGRLCADGFAGGEVTLVTDNAQLALSSALADVLNMTGSLLAFAVSEMVDDNMVNAARVHAVELGKDLSNRTLIAFGGAAPLHACRIAEKLGMQRVIVPVGAGVGSAIGFLRAPIAFEVVRSRYCRLQNFDAEAISVMFAQMRTEALAVVAGSTTGDEFNERRIAYMRYVGQGHEIVVEIPNRVLVPVDSKTLKDAFDAAYRTHFERIIPSMPVEILTWTLTLTVDAEAPSAAGFNRLNGATAPDLPEPPAAINVRELFDPERVDYASVPVYRRSELSPGICLSGPVVITEDQTTTVVSTGFDVKVNAIGYLDLIRKTGTAEP